MHSDNRARGASAGETGTLAAGKGRYLYCIAEGGEAATLGHIGIDGHEVYTLPHRDISAVVHDCLAAPYPATDPERVTAWVLTHQKVVDAAWERWGTVLPLSFNTIVDGKGETEPDVAIKTWLLKDYPRLKARMEGLRGKAEYGVQVLWEPEVIARKLVAASPELSRLEEDIRSRPRGVAYMYRQKLQNALRREMESKADQYFRDLYHRIRRHVDDIVVEDTKAGHQDAQMFMNLSCLLSMEGCAALGEELERINTTEEFSVRFTGPWPPYSFVNP